MHETYPWCRGGGSGLHCAGAPAPPHEQIQHARSDLGRATGPRLWSGDALEPMRAVRARSGSPPPTAEADGPRRDGGALHAARAADRGGLPLGEPSGPMASANSVYPVRCHAAPSASRSRAFGSGRARPVRERPGHPTRRNAVARITGRRRVRMHLLPPCLRDPEAPLGPGSHGVRDRSAAFGYRRTGRRTAKSPQSTPFAATAAVLSGGRLLPLSPRWEPDFRPAPRILARLHLSPGRRTRGRPSRGRSPSCGSSETPA